MCYKVTHYQYKDRIGNLKAEAVGVVSGEKHFPIFPGNMIFKPLTKSKPFFDTTICLCRGILVNGHQ